MNDLEMHVAHLPLRLGWRPAHVYAQLQKGVSQRPDRRGGIAQCDTWNNALLHCGVEMGDGEMSGERVPIRWEMKRLASGESNSWFIEVLGARGGVKFSSKAPKTLHLFEIGGQGEQGWKSLDLGHESAFETVTGGIFEFGFPDSILQMLVAFASERAGVLGDRFGMVTPDEAVQSQRIWAAARQSFAEKRAVEIAF